jgi:hypothetical protein
MTTKAPIVATNILIAADGTAPSTHVPQGGSVTWTLSSNATLSYSIDPPANLFTSNPACFTLSSGQTSTTYNVKTNAGLGNHDYKIFAGDCPKQSTGSGVGMGPRVGTGNAVIIVDTGEPYPKA